MMAVITRWVISTVSGLGRCLMVNGIVLSVVGNEEWLSPLVNADDAAEGNSQCHRRRPLAKKTRK